MAHVHHLVSEHALDLGARQRPPEAFRDAHHGVLRVTTRGEGVRLVAGRDRHGRHRQVGSRGEPGDHLVQLGRLSGGDDAGAGRPQRQLVALPIREPDDGQTDQQADDQPGAPTEQPADGDGQPRKASQQGEGLESVLVHGKSVVSLDVSPSR
jgi:hypothetical protein